MKKIENRIEHLGEHKVSSIQRLMLFELTLVKPYSPCSSRTTYTGEIMKLPQGKPRSYYSTDEAWKADVVPKHDFKVGDIILYDFKMDINLDNEILHLVPYFIGRLK